MIKNMRVNKLEKITMGLSWSLSIGGAVISGSGMLFDNDYNRIYVGVGMIIASLVPATVAAISYSFREYSLEEDEMYGSEGEKT